MALAVCSGSVGGRYRSSIQRGGVFRTRKHKRSQVDDVSQALLRVDSETLGELAKKQGRAARGAVDLAGHGSTTTAGENQPKRRYRLLNTGHQESDSSCPSSTTALLEKQLLNDYGNWGVLVAPADQEDFKKAFLLTPALPETQRLHPKIADMTPELGMLGGWFRRLSVEGSLGVSSVSLLSSTVSLGFRLPPAESSFFGPRFVFGKTPTSVTSSPRFWPLPFVSFLLTPGDGGEQLSPAHRGKVGTDSVPWGHTGPG